MKSTSPLTIAASVLILMLAGCASSPDQARCRCQQGWCNIRSDHSNYYSCRNLGKMAVGFGVGATMANTRIDQNLQDWWQDDVRSTSTDDFAKHVKNFGEGQYVIAASVAAAAIGELYPDLPLTAASGQWGRDTARAYLVGGPPMLFMQAATGASRPGETRYNSDWKPFDDSNGVSGHSFVGAVPFITAAKMTDNPWLKATYYTGSTLAGWSRINDDAHYTSQVVLGWWMAYLACESVDLTNQQNRSYEVVPMVTSEGTGVSIIFHR